MRRQEINDEEERMIKRQEVSSSSGIMGLDISPSRCYLVILDAKKIGETNVVVARPKLLKFLNDLLDFMALGHLQIRKWLHGTYFDGNFKLLTEYVGFEEGTRADVSASDWSANNMSTPEGTRMLPADRSGVSSTTKPFTVNLYHDGVFIVKPFNYTHGDYKVIDDVDFDGLLYVQMYDIIRRVVLVSPTCLYFKLVDQPLVCLKPLKTDEDVGLFVKALYENGSIINLYCEHNGYDIMEMIQDQLAPKDQLVKTTFKCNADDVAHTSYENLDDLKDIVDFEVEGEENIVITRNTTDDPWLNKLVGNGTFIGQTDDATSNLGGRFNHEENDPEDDIVDPKFKAKPFVRYPSFDPSTLWDQCQLVLGDTPDDAECSSKPATKKNGRSSEAIKERQAVLESNPGSTCHLETKDRDDDGKITFKRMYICFKGIKQGWLDACRKVIGLDGCFLTHTCKGQLLTAFGRDGNNQMYPITWFVVGVENKDNWAWFLSLLQEDLELGYGGGLTVISDGHKGLLEAHSLREHLKMEMEIPCSNKIKFITACSFSNDSFEDIMKAQISVIKASATLNIQAFKIKKSVSISF
ncbi:flavonoid 3'-monooxygenase-like protein [Tanacetum coccineum]